MKRLISLTTFLIIFLSSTFLYSEDRFMGYDNLTCRLKLQKSSFELGEPIIVQFQVINMDYNPVEIKLSEKPYYNFTFSIKSIKNQKINMVGDQERFYREKVDTKEDSNKINKISLNYEQFYGQSFDLTKYYRLNQPGHYVIQGFFTPVPENIRKGIQKRSQIIQSQIIQLEIRESHYQEMFTLQQKIKEEIELQKVRNPYETVQFMLKARIEQKWNRYFKYIDLNRLIKEYPRYDKKYAESLKLTMRELKYRELNQRYESLKPSKREPIIKEFKEYLKGYLTEIGYNNLYHFEIYKSVIENQKKRAKVFSKIHYKGEGITFYRKYVFYLYQRNRRWYIYSWKVENL